MIVPKTVPYGVAMIMDCAYDDLQPWQQGGHRQFTVEAHIRTPGRT